MEQVEKSKQFSWFIPLRFASFIILFSVVVFWMGYPLFLRLQFVIYSVLTLAFALFITFDKKLKLINVTSSLIALQFVFEILIESGIIYATGNINSPFSGLFILAIVSAALIYGMVGTLLIASVVSIAYAFIIWFGLVGSADTAISLHMLQTVFVGKENAFYSILLHILIFYLVAFISGFLAEKLKTQDKQLKDSSIALRKARLETDEILHHLNSGLLTIDAKGFIIYFNRAAEKILGFRSEDVRGLHCSDVFSERMPELADFLIQGTTQLVQYPRKETEIINHENVRIPLGLSTSILTEDNGTLRGVITIFSNLTSAKNMEAKVRAADRLAAVGELSASIAHEIRNPLASISGSVEVLKNELELEDDNKKLMDLIVKESHRLSRILSDFLSYARVDKRIYNKVELCHVVTDVIQLLYHHNSYHSKIDINFETDHSITYVVGDEDLFRQLLLNLAVNACEAMETKEGELVFRIARNLNSNFIELYVQDNGPGIEAIHLKNIYKPFYSTKKGGTGLGLSIVHRICTALRLNLSVDSQLSEGTTFLIEIPEYTSDPITNPKESDPNHTLKPTTA